MIFFSFGFGLKVDKNWKNGVSSIVNKQIKQKSKQFFNTQGLWRRGDGAGREQKSKGMKERAGQVLGLVRLGF